MALWDDQRTNSRRDLLKTAGLAAGAALAGCLEIDDPAVPHRDLGIRDIEITEQEPNNITIRITPLMSWQANSTEWATFHDVSLVGIDDAGDLICRKSLGDMIGRGDQEPIELSCRAFPHVVKYEADESPCAPDTRIDKAVYDRAVERWDVMAQCPTPTGEESGSGAF